MGTHIRIFHSGDYKGHEGLEAKVNAFCSDRIVQKVSTASRSCITLSHSTQVASTTYDIIVVYEDNDGDKEEPITKDRGAKIIQLYAAIKTASTNERRERAWERYVKFVEEAVDEMKDNLTYTTVAQALESTPVAMKARDKRISTLLGRQVNSISEAAANRDLTMLR